jgi:hypothetical protein
MNAIYIKLIPVAFIFIYFICTGYELKFSQITYSDSSPFNQTYQQQKPKQKNTTSHTITGKALYDTTFTLKIENEKRIVDDALKARLIRELKNAIRKNHLKKPYKIAMGFTKGARDVETFFFGEQIFYTLAESGFTITGTPVDMPAEATNPIPQIKVIKNSIYIVLSKLL